MPESPQPQSYLSLKEKQMRSPSKKEKQLPALLNQVGLELPNVIDNLNSTLKANKENFAIVKGIMDNKTQLTERIKLLELELFIAVLRKL